MSVPTPTPTPTPTLGFATAPGRVPPPPQPPAPPAPPVVVVPVAPPSFLHPVTVLPTSNDARGLGADAARGLLGGTTFYGFMTGLLHLCEAVGLVAPGLNAKYGPGIAGVAASVAALAVTWLSNHTPPGEPVTTVEVSPDPGPQRVP